MRERHALHAARIGAGFREDDAFGRPRPPRAGLELSPPAMPSMSGLKELSEPASYTSGSRARRERKLEWRETSHGECGRESRPAPLAALRLLLTLRTSLNSNLRAEAIGVMDDSEGRGREVKPRSKLAHRECTA